MATQETDEPLVSHGLGFSKGIQPKNSKEPRAFCVEVPFKVLCRKRAWSKVGKDARDTLEHVATEVP